MKKFIIILLVLLSSAVYGVPGLLIHFPDTQVNQGSIVKARLSLDVESFQKIDIQKMKGQTLAETIYIYNVSTFIRRSGENWFDADASVIFLKVPKSKSLLHKNEQSEIQINLSDVSVKETEEPQGFIFGDFSAPEKKKYLFWFWVLLSFILLAGIGYKLNKKYKEKKELKRRIEELKSELLNVSSFEAAVIVWQKKQDYLKAFPGIEPAFLDFQAVLFKYLFKPKQTEAEKQEVLSSYKSVSQSIQELKDGV